MQDFYRKIGNVVIEQSKNLKAKDDERLKLNAKFKAQKIKQKKKLFNEIQECLYKSIKIGKDYKISKLNVIAYLMGGKQV